jgi:hypothetical protein
MGYGSASQLSHAPSSLAHSAAAHYTGLKNALQATGIQADAVTHLGRSTMATHGARSGVAADSLRAAGVWRADAFRACYNRYLPQDQMLAAARFDPAKPELYFLPRAETSASPL